ncbi:MAG: OadG family transporter subunit [Chromatiales bacterium]|jgi:oxaloacetate decarboxylase gamma subunit
MPISEMLMSGVKLMAVGMGIVFVFLLALVFVMKGMSRLAMSIAERQAGAQALTYPPAGATQGEDNVRGDLIAAISAAVSRYRATHK